MFKKLVLVAGFLRFIGPFFIFSNPLSAIAIVWLGDLSDGHLTYHLGWSWRKYNRWDKLFDLWWYVFILIFSFVSGLTIFPLLLVLFLFRLGGQAFALRKNNEKYFLMFPNIYEMYFILYILALYFSENFLDYFVGPKQLLPLFLAGAFSLSQEYRIHAKGISIGHILPIRGLKIDWSKRK